MTGDLLARAGPFCHHDEDWGASERRWGGMLGTAADLWREWERAGVLRPGDYDSDVARHVRDAAGGGSVGEPIADVLDRAGWTVRDLVHALAPLVASFAGMLRDLLRLLTRVGATSGTGDDLHVVYEFDEGDAVDQSLSAFRETVRRVESVAVRVRPLVFDASHAFASPIRELWSQEWVEGTVRASGVADRSAWPFAAGLPPAPATGDPLVDERLDRITALIDDVLAVLSQIGQDTAAVDVWLQERHRSEESTTEAIANAARDFWPLTAASAVHMFAAGVAKGELSPDGALLARLDEWLGAFRSADEIESVVEQTVNELADVLKLPTWGRRHELYSAWIATQLDRALASARLEFVVRDGAVRFPFHATLLARLDPPGGRVELWCEVRSSAVEPIGRKEGIQPDYRFVRRDAAGETTVAAVEVKQYLQAATKNPGAALHDYVLGLPEATVLLVAHGKLGARVLDSVPVEDRHRALVHRDVRVGRPRESAAFRADILALFPPTPPAPPSPPPTRPARIELSWAPTVRDLDLHVAGTGREETAWGHPSSAHSSLRCDAKDGGPEIVDLVASSRERLEIAVRLFSTDAASVGEADPVVSIVWDDARRIALRAGTGTAGSRERRWNVAAIDDAGTVIPSSDSVVVPLGERAEHER
ncbi:hypothetical protein [Microbacterium ulmi]|uniref:hypothetical protein n=1 Tax=Microbacterium ulmi TaxID=179095 RepID=UPI00141FD962|nr:hypothetical protein [Microbacterium ulmi]